MGMLSIPQCLAVGGVVVYVDATTLLNVSAVGTLLAAVRLDRLFILTFTPFLVVILVTLCWRGWKAINKSQH